MCDSSSEVEAIKKENGLLKFEAEAATRLSAHDKLIREAEFYRGLLASILKWLGLGSFGALIVVVVTVPVWLHSYLDAEIASRVKEWDGLERGILLAGETQWPQALKQLMEVYNTNGESRDNKHAGQLSTQYRSLLFNELLFVLASTSDRVDGGQQWLGEDEWNALTKDSEFRDEFKSRHDEACCNRMFLCTLKFSKDKNSLEQLVAYQSDASKFAGSEQSHAAHLFELAMIDLIKGEIDEAKKQLDEAKNSDEANFGDDNVVNYLATYKSQAEFKMWSSYARRVKSGVSPQFDFDTLFEKLLNEVAANAKASAVTGR